MAASFVILKAVNAAFGLRVTTEHEISGLDLSQHSETAYSLLSEGLGTQVVVQKERLNWRETPNPIPQDGSVS